MALDQLPGCTFFRLCIFAKVPALLFVQQSNVIMSLRVDKYFFCGLASRGKRYILEVIVICKELEKKKEEKKKEEKEKKQERKEENMLV